MTLCFDIDDTILYSEYINGEYAINGANEDLIKIINYLYGKGTIIILHTGRHWNHFQKTKQQLEFYEVKYHTLICGKPVADFYIDDKGVPPEKFLEMVRK